MYFFMQYERTGDDGSREMIRCHIIVSLTYVYHLLTYVYKIATCRKKSKCSNRKKDNIMIVAAKGMIGYYKFSYPVV